MLKLPFPLILASRSPRRKEILEKAGLDFTVIPSDYEEPRHSDHLSDPKAFVEEIALQKGKEVFERMGKKCLVLSADTIGVIEDTVLEKPRDREDAKRMLKLMSGRKHVVLTAIALFAPHEENPVQETVSTEVFFRALEEGEIEHYLDVAEYQDKAAAYAIQGEAAIFVEKIIGDYLNIVGLPLVTVWKMLGKISP
ncbi:MAG: nucleoside triphosphate pyrophosphatase [bacterium]|nr:nucleoside triphosphate pyrophosphatase [bacterium]